MKESCHNCKFRGEQETHNYREDVCRRFPPAYNGNRNYPTFPTIVQGSYLNPPWCGEWQLEVEEEKVGRYD